MGRFCGSKTCKIVIIFLIIKMANRFNKEIVELYGGDGLICLKILMVIKWILQGN